MADLVASLPTVVTGEENTVDYLLSRVLSEGSIYRKTELISYFPRWLNDVKENKVVSARVPELLARVLLSFGTPAAHKSMEDFKASQDFSTTQDWVVELRILINDKADERFLQNLNSLPDRVISFEELCVRHKENASTDFLVIDPHRNQQFDHDMRDVMTRGDKTEMRNYLDIFYVTGSVAWTIKSPYWHIALATDDAGDRFLSNTILDRVLPKWRHILNGDKVPTPRYGVTDSFRAWLASERKKALTLGKAWPEKPVNIVSSVSKPRSSEPRSSDFMSRLRSTASSRISSVESTPMFKQSENTQLLREILTELKELKLIIRESLASKEELMNTEMQNQEPWQQPYPAVPQALHPSFIMPEQVPMGSPQFVTSTVNQDPTTFNQDWQHLNSPYHTPNPTSGQGSRFTHRS